MTYKSPLLAWPGAVEADLPDAGVAAHYGDFYAEQRRYEAGGWVDLSHHDLVRISGAERLDYLQAMTSQAFAGLEPGRHVETLVLSPQGHIEHAFGGWDDGETFLAHTEPGRGAALVELIESTRFMMRIEAGLAGEYALVDDAGAGLVLVERAALGMLVEGASGGADGGGIPAAVGAEATVARGAPSGVWAHEALRIAAGRPRFGLDTDHRTIPNELGLIGTVAHVDKGCYRGQETVARVHNLGRPPRRLVRLHLDGSVDRLPARGAEVSADGGAIGFVGSSARHHELGPIALALVKRSTPVDAPLLADGIAASQEALVDPDVGLHVRAALR
ncbi:MAG TPA: folate-binding protein [Nocardioidaceae bacterium]|nr:folate-binding protein [Nocardioidaceae bacterium]